MKNSTTRKDQKWMNCVLTVLIFCLVICGNGWAKEPTTALEYRNRGYLFHKLNEPQKAIADYTKVIELDLKNAEAYYNRGFSFAKLGEIEKVEADLEKARKLDPSLKGN